MNVVRDPLIANDTLQELYYDLARDDYAFYCQLVHRGLYKSARHTDLIAKKLEAVERGECKRLIITLPPRHSKSMTVSETFPSWFIGKNPNRRVIEISYGDNLARKFGRENKRKLEEFGKDIFNISISRENASGTNFGIQGYRGGMISSGIGGSITGEGAHLLLIDDPIKNRKEANSITFREMVWNEWQNTLLTRLQPNGAVIVILTRWTEDDLVGRLLATEKEKWDVISLPAEAESEDDLLGREIGEPLWAEYGFDKAWIEEKKKEVGSIVWNALYQQRPSAMSGQIIKRKWFNFYQQLPGDIEEYAISVDCSFKDLSTSDFVVAQVWAKKGANRYLLDSVRDRLGIRATMDTIRTLSAKYPEAHLILIEDKANGSAVIEMLKNEIPGIVPYSPKESKESRVFAIAPSIESGNVFLPEPTQAPWVHDFIEEVVTFPQGMYDDHVDAMTQILIRWQQITPLFIGRA